MHASVAIREQFAAAQAAYLEASDANAAKERELRELHERVKQLQAQLSASIVGDAVPCSRCGAAPHGLRHVRGSVGKHGVASFRHVFEIGCVACADPIGDDRRGFGETPAKASGPELDQFAEAAIAAARSQWNDRQITLK